MRKGRIQEAYGRSIIGIKSQEIIIFFFSLYADIGLSQSFEEFEFEITKTKPLLSFRRNDTNKPSLSKLNELKDIEKDAH